MSKSIVLIGPMGAGKTTLGKRLAKTLELAFTDTDKLISRKHGSIPDIFTDKGEAHFRQLESAALEQALETGGVIATGGGIVLSEANRALLKGQRVIFLDTTMEYVLKSLNTEKRPLLKQDPANWQVIYDQRLPLYRECASATVRTDNRPVDTILQELEREADKNV